jgi:light-regulated signal transduction histidine kinase (bacteriophytochrome)
MDYIQLTGYTPRPYKMTDLGKLTQQVLEVLDLQINNSNATIQVGALPTLEIDPTQITTVLQNLISNAIKYHRQDLAPVVSLTSSYDEEGKAWNIEISDNGIGIEENDYKRIFNQFQRLHGRSAYEGTGIGLAICKKIVDRHGGNIQVNSILGNGSTFIITLPAQQVRPA